MRRAGGTCRGPRRAGGPGSRIEDSHRDGGFGRRASVVVALVTLVVGIVLVVVVPGLLDLGHRDDLGRRLRGEVDGVDLDRDPAWPPSDGRCDRVHDLHGVRGGLGWPNPASARPPAMTRAATSEATRRAILWSMGVGLRDGLERGHPRGPRAAWRFAQRENAHRHGLRPLDARPPSPAQCAAMHVLVVEDEPKMAALIRRVLVAERHVVDVAPDGVSAVALADAGPHDVIVLDRMLPDIDGFTVLRLLRAKGIATPVLMLTALGTVDDRVAGLDAGADDYLAKPFAFSELLARIRALGRRPAAAARDPPRGRRPRARRAAPRRRRSASGPSTCPRASSRCWASSSGTPNQVVTRQQILDQVWGAEPDVYSNVVDLYVSYLRRKLGELDRADRLRTVRGVGYTLEAED